MAKWASLLIQASSILNPLRLLRHYYVTNALIVVWRHGMKLMEIRNYFARFRSSKLRISITAVLSFWRERWQSTRCRWLESCESSFADTNYLFLISGIRVGSTRRKLDSSSGPNSSCRGTCVNYSLEFHSNRSLNLTWPSWILMLCGSPRKSNCSFLKRKNQIFITLALLHRGV